MAINLEHQRQSYCHLGRRHGQNEQEHNLAVGPLPSRTSYDERQPCSVEHHLQRHQDEKQITPHEQAYQPQREQDPR
jgi:hypothetical protein